MAATLGYMYLIRPECSVSHIQRLQWFIQPFFMIYSLVRNSAWILVMHNCKNQCCHAMLPGRIKNKKVAAVLIKRSSSSNVFIFYQTNCSFTASEFRPFNPKKKIWENSTIYCSLAANHLKWLRFDFEVLYIHM